MINCIIVDDEQHSIEILEHYVQQAPNLNLVLATTKAVDAINLITQQQIDLLFLDVQMPEISGIEVVHAINGKCKVIFTTAYERYAVQGYELDVIDFLLKPISISRFLRSVQKATEIIASQQPRSAEDDYIYVKTGVKSQVEKITLKGIQYIESTRNSVAVHQQNKCTTVAVTLKEIEDHLPSGKFIRVHKSFIVAYDQIESVSGNRIYLKNSDANIVIGSSYKELFWSRINTKLLK